MQRFNLGKALNDAIDRDDVEAVRDICSGTSECPLRQTGFVLRAMKRRSITTALVLVELLGTDVEMNQVDSKGRTVLHEAVAIRNDGLFDRILETGIEIDVRDHAGTIPYENAISSEYFHAIRSLMHHAAADHMHRDNANNLYMYQHGMRAAAASGANDILEVQFSSLVSAYKKTTGRKASDDFISNSLTRTIAKAASNGHESTVKLILELAHALDLEGMYHGLLRKELHHGIEAMTTSLMLRYGKATQEIGKNGKTYGNTLATAAMNGDSIHVMRLLKEGADIDYADKLAYNALGAASSRGNLSMVTLLVEQGADVKAKGGYSGNALYLACHGGHMDVVRFLFEKGADINARSKYGDTALIGASEKKRLDAVQFLVEKGADVYVQNRSGETALFAAYRHGHKEIIRILASRAQILETSLSQALMTRQEDILQLLLKQASCSQLRTAVQILVKDPTTVTTTGGVYDEALCLACSHGMEELIEVLLEVGDQLTIPVEICDRALRLIGSRKYVAAAEYQKIAKLLRERRALAAPQP